ncbi:hypothetical protein FACS1894171_0880 [Clostridia bacterium]|nr:hypothetical protein FACS1894171_0880 [Clostridia bacterium]
MRYFVLKQDERITDIPYPKDFFENIDVRNVSAERGDSVPFRTLIQLRPSAFTVFPDVFCTPVLLLTPDAQNIVRLYDDYIVYRQIIYLDQVNELVNLYFMPLLQTIDCLSTRSEYVNAGKGAFSKVVLKAELIRDESIFQVKNQQQRVTVIRLDLAESLLARGCRGFTLAEAEIEA